MRYATQLLSCLSTMLFVGSVVQLPSFSKEPLKATPTEPTTTKQLDTTLLEIGRILFVGDLDLHLFVGYHAGRSFTVNFESDDANTIFVISNKEGELIASNADFVSRSTAFQFTIATPESDYYLFAVTSPTASEQVAYRITVVESTEAEPFSK
ncbi:MAG: hypothetical protein HLUCCA11_24055 [Phormidesmis priestleyi Ana]|uniref:Peptidase C-terminal archaeal/bacterial domain-containing protein n=1 Tax=Phormidesmis priestleyi Ana TaxID=1666911 RepID=A0A0P8BRP8_9CYAN|nr:MAG: hypothetical protein HLUCCA11_24055 [Phormidesmis priestleyi Ana]